MKAAPVENDQAIGFHADEEEQFPIGVAVVDIGIVPVGEHGVEDHAVLKIFIPLRTVEKFITEFQPVGQFADFPVRLDGYSFQVRGHVPVQAGSAHAGVRGVQVDHGGDVLVDMGLTLPDVETVLMVGDALKYDRLGVEKRVEARAPELTDCIHDRLGLDVHRCPHAGKVADYLESIGIRKLQGLLQDLVGIPVEPVDHDDLVPAHADVFDGDLAVGIDRKGFRGGWHE